MKKRILAILVITIFLAGMITYGELTPLVRKTCCISGVYKGWHKDIASLTCPEPGKGEFTMYLYQEKGCGSKIWGKIVDPADPGDPMKFKGIVERGAKGCCRIKGTASKPGESIKFKGVICKIRGKWMIKKGTFKNSRGCAGTFGMKWVRAHLLLTPRSIK